MNKIDVTVKGDGSVLIDLGGDLDAGCCGCEASAFHEELGRLGLRLRLKRVCCRLPETERLAAKLQGKCRWNLANPLKSDPALDERRST